MREKKFSLDKKAHKKKGYRSITAKLHLQCDTDTPLETYTQKMTIGIDTQSLKVAQL